MAHPGHRSLRLPLLRRPYRLRAPRPTYDLLEETDLLIFVGTVPGDVITDGFLCRQDWNKKNFLVTIDPSLRGRSGPVSYQIVAKPDVFIRDLAKIELPVKDEWKAGPHGCVLNRKPSRPPSATPTGGQARMDTLMANLVPTLPADAMITLGAGEHTNWAHRYFPTQRYASMISARNGSMGYSVPSAIAASLAYPGRRDRHHRRGRRIPHERPGTRHRAQYGATPLVIVMDNQEYGTIRTHQERHYPDRVSGTQLKNPDFALMAQAFGGFGIKVEQDAISPPPSKRRSKPSMKTACSRSSTSSSNKGQGLLSACTAAASLCQPLTRLTQRTEVSE
jgi:acetolactate synthase-1/2/3 large subunit